MTTSGVEKLNDYVRSNAPKSAAPDDMRAWFANLVSVTPIPDEAKLEKSTCSVPAYWIRPSDANPERVLLYLHGGGYILGSAQTHLELTYRLAKTAGVRSLSVEYRLLPENRYPACVDDAIAAYQYLLNEGISPKHIAIGGDSAGGGITLQTALRIRDEGLPQPGGLVCFSPWTDFTASGESIGVNGPFDPMVDPKMIGYLGSIVVGDRDPVAMSPLFANLANMPPLFLQAGTKEVLFDDSTRLAKRYEEAGSKVVFQAWENMSHVFQAFPTFVPEAIPAIEQAAAFLRENLG